MEESSTKIKFISEEIKFNVPLITKEELRYIDYHYNSLVNKYLSEYKSQRDHLLTQRLIYNLERENKKLKKQNKFLMKRENKLHVLEMKQKEFIKCLEDMLDNESDIFSVVRVKDVLQKYKEIIGADNSD